MIRETEAVRGAVVTGSKEEWCHFLKMPFYDTGKIKKGLINEVDIKLCQDLIEKVLPS